MLKFFLMLTLLSALTFLLSFWIYKKEKRMKFLNTLSLTVGIIGTLVSLFLYFFPLNDTTGESPDHQLEPDITIDGDKNNIVTIQGDQNTVDVDNENYFLNQTYIFSDDEESLLKQAETFYQSHYYQGVVQIYLHERLKDNPIALCNLGYIYETGLSSECFSLEPDVKKAYAYYSQVDTIYGKRHLLALYIKYIDDLDIINDLDILWGLVHELWEIDPTTRDYLAYCNFGCSEDEYWDYYSDETSMPLTLDAFYKWEFVGTQTFHNIPSSTRFQKWEATGFSYSETDSHLITIYKVNEYRIKYLDLLKADFVSLDDLT